MQHLMIINDVKIYDKSQDPELCDALVQKIDLFNDKCEPQVETLDCG